MHPVLRFSWSLGKFLALNVVIAAAVIGALHVYFYHFG